MKTHLTLAYSPCPNDTYIFGGIALNLIESPLTYDIALADIAALNTMAQAGEYDVIKLSYHAWASMIDDYQMLPYGSALGFGVGPLLIVNPGTELSDIIRVAIPGKHTTANFLLDFAYKDYGFEKVEMVFSDIESELKSGRVDAGVIIHENRFTYAERGFVCIQDLGDYWEKKTELPIPLGGIAIKRSLDDRVKSQVARDIKSSIQLADDNFTVISSYIKQHAQEMDISVMQQHIDLYVNQSTRGLSDTDRASIDYLLSEIANAGNLSPKDGQNWLFDQ